MPKSHQNHKHHYHMESQLAELHNQQDKMPKSHQNHKHHYHTKMQEEKYQDLEYYHHLRLHLRLHHRHRHHFAYSQQDKYLQTHYDSLHKYHYHTKEYNLQDNLSDKLMCLHHHHKYHHRNKPLKMYSPLLVVVLLVETLFVVE